MWCHLARADACDTLAQHQAGGGGCTAGDQAFRAEVDAAGLFVGATSFLD